MQRTGQQEQVTSHNAAAGGRAGGDILNNSLAIVPSARTTPAKAMVGLISSGPNLIQNLSDTNLHYLGCKMMGGDHSDHALQLLPFLLSQYLVCYLTCQPGNNDCDWDSGEAVSDEYRGP